MSKWKWKVERIRRDGTKEGETVHANDTSKDIEVQVTEERGLEARVTFIGHRRV